VPKPLGRTIDTLIPDIYSTLRGLGKWDSDASKAFAEDLSAIASSAFQEPEEYRSYVGMSSLGRPCKRSLWLKVNEPHERTPPKGSELLKFFYGHTLESLILNIIRSTDHTVEGEQDELEINGIFGHRDAVIDGITIDIKSSAPFSFDKYKKKGLRFDDPFGYVSQISSYVYAARDDPLVVHKDKGAVLFINKVTGELHLELLDLTEDLKTKELEVEELKQLIVAKEPPPVLSSVLQYKDSSNLKLCSTCGYCNRKFSCFPDVRMFAYSNSIEYLTYVEREPKVPEIFHKAKTQGT
jgi:hypothetical protein